ncbi:MAG: alpha-amylase family glycosyl hydrolase [Ilumatobacteraceae bacterium]
MPAANPWWRDAVIYQAYVRSFADADGDGLGDLPGVRSRLPYLRRLGIDAVWLNPCYPSPQADAGYDVADYRDVDPRFGTLQDMDGLVADAHALGLRVILDIVPNHTSDEHAWFQAALASAPGSPERARYMFRDGRGPEGAAPPNDWTSNFGGPAWTRVTETDGRPGQWYLHLFDTKQPDLDWTNDEVRAEFMSILRFWFDRGVDGFRIDVAHGLAKDPAMPDLAGAWPAAAPAPEGHPHWDVDEVHDVYREWRTLSDSYDGDRAFVGEVWVASPERLARYLRPDELHTAFNFGFLLADWTVESLRDAIDTSIGALATVGAPPTWVLYKHDVTRHVTRYGGGERGVRRARAAALLMLALPGGAYVYQGEELGLPEVVDLPDELRQDPTFARTRGEVKGRDGCRVPIPWSGDEPPFGFGPGGTPWLPQPAEWAALTVAREEQDATSMLSLYRDALALRRDHPALGDGDMTWLDVGPGAIAFHRQPGFACVVNIGDRPLVVHDELLRTSDVLVSSAPLGEDRTIPGATAVWYAVTGLDL